MSLKPLCELADIPDGQARGFVLGDVELLVVRQGSECFAYLNVCPHRATSLDWAPDRFMSSDGVHLQCATHGALFQVRDGRCVSGPCEGQSLTRLAVELRDGAVLVGGVEPGS